MRGLMKSCRVLTNERSQADTDWYAYDGAGEPSRIEERHHVGRLHQVKEHARSRSERPRINSAIELQLF